MCLELRLPWLAESVKEWRSEGVSSSCRGWDRGARSGPAAEVRERSRLGDAMGTLEDLGREASSRGCVLEAQIPIRVGLDGEYPSIVGLNEIVLMEDGEEAGEGEEMDLYQG